MSSLSVRTMVLVWTFPARRVTTVTQIYGWAPRRGGRQRRRGTACPVQDHPVMVYIGAGHPAPAENRASMSVRRNDDRTHGKQASESVDRSFSGNRRSQPRII